MSDFFGVISRNQQPIEKDWLTHMQKAMATWEPDESKILHQPHFSLGQNTLRITPESYYEHLPETNYGLSLVANARIDNREELLKQLDVPRAEVITDSSIILAAFQKWGTACAEKLIGEFAFAIWDEKEHTLFCARDAIGVRPVYYHIGSEFIIISTEVRGILASGLVPKKPNKLIMAFHLSSFKGEQDQTIYEGILSLKGAHWLLSKDNNIRIERYWSASVKPELKLRNNREYEEAFSEKLQVAVKRGLRIAGTAGSLMSGGLDSTAITGIALKQNTLDKPLEIHSWVYGAGVEQDQPDDRPYVESFLEFHGSGNYHHSYIHGLDGYFTYLPQFQALCDQPYLDMELPARFNSYKEFQKKDVRVILSGVGGDEFATHNAYEYPFHLFSQGRFLKLFKTLKSIRQHNQKTWRNTLARHLVYPYRAARAGLEPWGRGYPFSGRNFLESRKGQLFLHPDLLEKTSFEEYVLNHQSTQNLPSAFNNPLKNWLLMNLDHSGMENSFNKRYHLTQSYKMQYTYPFLDREVISFLLSLPVDQFHQNGLGRSIVRRGMGDFVPQKVLMKQEKIGSAPFIKKTRNEDLPWVFQEFEKWKNHSLIAETVDLNHFKQHLMDLSVGKEQVDRYYVRTVFLCNFLYNSFN